MTPSFWQGFAKKAALKADLQPHQVRSQKKLDKTDALLLYHGLGSGKTLSSIAATEGKPADVVVPAALRGNYRKEVEQYTDKKTPRNIMSYEAAAKRGLPGGEALVVDEVQRLNNPGSRRSQAIIDAAPRYKKRILLSGTPIKNHPSELAPILRILNPHDRSTPLDQDAFREKFLREVEVRPGIFGRLLGVKPGTVEKPRNLEKLREALRGKVDYYDPPKKGFPSRSERVETVPMTDEQNAIYRYVTRKADPLMALKVRMGLPMSKRETKNLNAFMSGARMVSNTAKPFGGKGRSPKFERALSHLEEGIRTKPNFKALAYSNYLAGGVKEYASYLEEKGISHGVFSGQLSDKKRKALVDDYNKGKIQVLLISGAGAEGLDLKGTKMVQVLDPHWNKARTDQVEGRAVRFGSHAHLPENERHVDVVHYHSAHPFRWYNKYLKIKSPTSADQYLSDIAKKKDRLNQAFLDILREEGS